MPPNAPVLPLSVMESNVGGGWTQSVGPCCSLTEQEDDERSQTRASAPARALPPNAELDEVDYDGGRRTGAH